MSGQAKRSRVRAAIRHREQVARIIAEACGHLDICVRCGGVGRLRASGAAIVGETETRECEGCGGRKTGIAQRTRAFLGGERFNVALARAYGERLVREGTAALETWVVYCDWLTETGRIEGGIVASNHVAGWRIHRQAWADGPGRKPCPRCSDPGRALQGSESVVIATVTDFRGDPACTWCGGSRFVAGTRPRMDGATLVRMGRRLLAALDGQPSECRVCGGAGGYQASFSRSACLNCRGTGHNLAGTLPPIEWPAVVRRRAADSLDAEWRLPEGQGRRTWVHDAFGHSVAFGKTRSTPRGEHRTNEDIGAEFRDIAWRSLDERINARGWKVLRRFRCYPRWRQGEIHRRHTRARRVDPLAT